MVMLELTKKTIRTSMEVMVKDLVTRKKKVFLSFVKL